jgi:hypothetical protein
MEHTRPQYKEKTMAPSKPYKGGKSIYYIPSRN